MKAFYKTVGLAVLCNLFGKSRQAFYEQKWHEEKCIFEDTIIIDRVKHEQPIARRVGGRNLYQILKADLEARQGHIGRDRLFDVLRENGLLVKRRRRRTVTTMSRHPCTPTWRKRCWWNGRGSSGRATSPTSGSDAYSHQVVGWNFGAGMDAAFCVEALKMALASRSYPERAPMHHSDRGLPYCSRLYTDLLKGERIAISMTENGDPLENAVAERMNGMLKDSFELGRTFPSFGEAQQFILEAITYYNERRPHSSCDKLTPKEASERTGPLKRHWKSFSEKALAKAEREAAKGQNGFWAVMEYQDLISGCKAFSGLFL